MIQQEPLDQKNSPSVNFGSWNIPNITDRFPKQYFLLLNDHPELHHNSFTQH